MDSLVEANLNQIKDMMQRFGVVKASLFGSAATGNMTAKSDIDFLVSFNPKLSFTEYGDNYFNLIYALEALLNTSVEIIAEETLTNPYLIEFINSQRIAVL